MHLARRPFLAGLAAAAIPAAAPRGARAQSAPVRVALIDFEATIQPYYAQEQGMFARAALPVELTAMNNGGAIAAAVAGGAADVGATNLISFSLGHERGLPFEILAVGALTVAGVPTNGLLGVVRDAPIRTARDLSGKTVAVDSLQSLPHFAVRNWIDTNGGDSTAAKFIEMPFPQMVPALRAGRIDAALLNTTVAPGLGKPDDPLRLLALVYDAIAPRFAAAVWFSTNGWIAAHPDAARAFVNVMRESAQWANGHGHEAAEILAKQTKRPLEAIEKTPRITFATENDPALVQPVIDLAAKYGAIKKVFPAREAMFRPSA